MLGKKTIAFELFAALGLVVLGAWFWSLWGAIEVVLSSPDRRTLGEATAKNIFFGVLGSVLVVFGFVAFFGWFQWWYVCFPAGSFVFTLLHWFVLRMRITTLGRIKALRHDNPRVRLAAVVALGDSGSRHAVKPLIAVLENGSMSTRIAAAEGLGKLADLRAVEPLIVALRDKDADVRRAATGALGMLRDNRALNALLAALRDGNESEIRITAAQALGNLGDARAVEALRNVLGDRESRLRKDASEALAKLGETKWTQWLWGDAGDWGRLAKSADESVVEILISNLGSKEPATLEVVAQHLGDLGNKRAVEPLIDLLGHITGTVRKSAADALRKLGEPNWQQMVKGDGDDFSRLGMSGDPRAVRCLTAALQHPRLWTRRQAASALIKMAESNPKLIAGIWRDVAEAVNAPHTDKNVGTLAGGENHVDDGIGLKFPDEPPATDF